MSIKRAFPYSCYVVRPVGADAARENGPGQDDGPAARRDARGGPHASGCGALPAAVGGPGRGSVNQKLEPLPTTLVTPTRPPWAVMMAWQMYRPNPRLPRCTPPVGPPGVPPGAATPGARWNSSHTRARSAFGMPGPASRTATRAWLPHAATSTSTGWSGGEYLSPFVTQFLTTSALP